ncbi:MAG TPA: PTS sugar transporter subunit IIC [Longimicrobiales bacterium]|nr:PTS sugar transporter subunit IIC [Longimicrobiales bacterium]
MSWIATALMGGLVSLDATAFPQVMISRPLVAGALTGVLFGRPLEGLAIGFLVELFSLIILPVGAATYPDSGTATVAATSAYLAATPPGLSGGSLLLVLVFALFWERLGGATVVLQRRSNGRLLAEQGSLNARQLERRHLTAMLLDVARGAVMAMTGGVLGYWLLRILAPLWTLPEQVTLAVLGIVAAGMLGTGVPLFGVGRQSRFALAAGIVVGVLLVVVAR